MCDGSLASPPSLAIGGNSSLVTLVGETTGVLNPPFFVIKHLELEGPAPPAGTLPT